MIYLFVFIGSELMFCFLLSWIWKEKNSIVLFLLLTLSAFIFESE